MSLDGLKKSSLGGLFGLVPVWAQVLVIGLIAASLFLAGAKLNGKRWAAKYERLQHSYESAQAQAQAVAAQQTQANAEKSAQLDKTYYEEFQNAEKDSDYWRNRYLTERVPSRTKATHCAETRSSTGVVDDAAADIGADRSVDVSGSAIIELSESAKQMRAQVLYFQGKKSVDDVTVNGENDATK